MRGVSGVTGAGPLWNRIMLHLYERNADPPPFASPPGFVRVAICATTGRLASRRGAQCPAVVQEWVRPADVASLRARGAVAHLRILFPHDGDTFVLNPTRDALAQREQQLAPRAGGAHGAVRWSADGAPLALDAAGNSFWPLRLGTWRIEAGDGAQGDAVVIHVVARPQVDGGFTLEAPSR